MIDQSGMMETKSKKRILILAANPKATPKLRLDEEVREIKEGLLRSKYRDQFEIHSVWAVRRRDLRRALLDHKPHIVHFSGHGTEDGLKMEDEMGLAVTVSKGALSGLFEIFSGKVECVILSACYSGPQAAAISKHIDYVIGMKKEINDSAAIEFAVGFYDALGAGESVEDAFNLGRNAVQLEFPDQLDYLIPVLKKRKSCNDKNDKGQANNKVNNKGQAKKTSPNIESKGPTIIANTIGKIQNVDGDVTYNYDIENYYE
jgi:hypothetical protein